MALQCRAAAKLFGLHRIYSTFRCGRAQGQSRMACALSASNVPHCIQSVSKRVTSRTTPKSKSFGVV